MRGQVGRPHRRPDAKKVAPQMRLAHPLPRRAGPPPPPGPLNRQSCTRRVTAVESPAAEGAAKKEDERERGGPRPPTSAPAAPPSASLEEGVGGPPTPTACSSLLASAPSPLLYPFDPLPPSSRPLAIAEVVPGSLWTFTVPFYASPISKLSAENRMSVVKLDSGLAIFNPLTPTQPLLDGLAALNLPVSAIVIPSTSPEHWVGAAGMSSAFPAASVLAPPGFFTSGPGGGRIGGKLGGLKAASAVLDDAAVAGRASEVEASGEGPVRLWNGQVEAAVFRGKGGFCEAAFFLTATRTVLTADLAFGLVPGDLEATPGANWLDKVLARVAGIYGRLGCATWPVLRASPVEAGAFVSVLDGWVEGQGVERVIPAHLSAPWGGDALEGAFGFARRTE